MQISESIKRHNPMFISKSQLLEYPFQMEHGDICTISLYKILYIGKTMYLEKKNMNFIDFPTISTSKTAWS